jgi:F-type H+-transporting ATPase subunit b
MVFFQSFGVNVIYLVWYLAIFGVVLYLLRRYAFGPILKTIADRQDKINESLDAAQEATRSIDESRQKAEATIREAAEQARTIVTRAEKAAVDLTAQAREEARVQANLIAEKARAEIERERNAAVAEIRAQVVDLALLAAGRVIEANLDPARNRKLVEETIAQAEMA